MVKKLLTDSVIYGASKYLNVLVAIFLLPIYTRLLSKADYGIMDIFNSWNNLIIVILPLGLTTSIFRYYSDVKKSTQDKKEFLGTILVTLISLTLLYAFFSFLFKPLFTENIKHGQVSEIFNHSIFIVSGSILRTFFGTLAQAKLEKYKHLTVSLLNLSALVILGFSFVYYFDMGILGFFRASSIATGLSLITSIIFYFNDISLTFKKDILKRVLKYSIHIFSAGLLFTGTNLLDRFLLMEYGSLEDVGTYSIGVRISGFIALGVSSFALAWFPRAMELKNNKSLRDDTYIRVHNLYLIASFIGISGLTIFKYELIQIFAPNYQKSLSIVSILSLYIVINGLIYFYSLGIHITEKTKYITYSAIVSVIVNIICSIVLLKTIGPTGVAYGTLIGGMVWVFLQYKYSQSLININYKIFYLIMGILSFIFISFITEFIDSNFKTDLLIRVAIKLSLTLSFVTLIYFRFKSEIIKKLKRKTMQ